jgi:hypothetical protein
MFFLFFIFFLSGRRRRRSGVGLGCGFFQEGWNTQRG